MADETNNTEIMKNAMEKFEMIQRYMVFAKKKMQLKHMLN